MKHSGGRHCSGGTTQYKRSGVALQRKIAQRDAKASEQNSGAACPRSASAGQERPSLLRSKIKPRQLAQFET